MGYSSVVINKHNSIWVSLQWTTLLLFAACQCSYSDHVIPLSIAAKETCCQPPYLLLSLHCLPLSFLLLHCSWPEGTVGFLNALPPLWAHIDWLSAPPKAEQHGVPAASFLLVLLRKSLREKKQGEEIVRRLHQNLSRYVSSLLFLSASPVVMRINGV